jgi:phage shock protein C
LEDTDRFCSSCGRATGRNEPLRAPASPHRRLVRPMYDKNVAGVCSGFARYLGVDVILVRIIWLVTAIFTGVGFIAYLVAWLIMPKEEREPERSLTVRESEQVPSHT